MTATDTEKKGLRTWIEIDRKAIKHNVGQFRSIIPKETKLCAVVKSNAYGHGLVDFTKEVVAAGADFLAVDSVVEGVRLREEGIKLPILILGYTLPEKLKEAIDADLSISISHFEALEGIINLAKADRVFGAGENVPKIHIKVDTGMHRQGFILSDAKKLLKILSEPTKKGIIKVEGLFTHFAAAKNPAFPDRTNGQIAEFKKWVELFKESGHKPIVHAAATSGAILFPQSHFDMVRIGIGLYGLWPSGDTQAFAEGRQVGKNKNFNLKPVLTWKTIISEVKTLPEGGAIGYDFTETLPAKSKIVICPIGYWHGFPRALSSIGKVTIRGARGKIVGRISMDMIIVDATHIKNIAVGDEVVLIGGQISAKEIAMLMDSSWYELVTRINPLIKKIIV